ncbi:hypothetical protein [Cellulomonas telluris]|uniref:hypothetical protein n=1 Tax=Cellulomonas telluris TaxID=2306636 RepID=UPI0010A82043|nr:hypothetical protein [Cellulomonas telluris]
MARPVKVVVGVLATLLALVVAGVVLAVAVLPGLLAADEPPPVRPVVEAYLEAVAAGDAEAALALSQPDASGLDGASTALLRDDVLGGARERLTGARVTGEEVVGTSATVTVAYTLAGAPQEAELRLRVDEDAQEWRVLLGLLGTVRVEGLSGDAVPVEVAGVVPDPDADCIGQCAGTPAYTLFTAVYDVRADLSGFELHPHNETPAEQAVTVLPGTAERVRYLAVPVGDEWPVVNGTDTDPSPEGAEG